MACSVASIRRIGWRGRSISTWRRLAGDRRSTTISAASPRAGSSKSKGDAAGQLIDHLKKSEMAKEAERLLEDTRWLPEPLRLSEMQSPADLTDSSAQPLPEFLSGDGGGQTTEVDGTEPAQAVAAE